MMGFPGGGARTRPVKRPVAQKRAGEPPHQIRASAAVLARRRFALVHLDLAVEASPAGSAHAAVREHVVEARRGAIAGVRGALILLGEACSHGGVGVASKARALRSKGNYRLDKHV